MLGPINLQHTGELEWFLKTGGLRYLALYLWTSIMIPAIENTTALNFAILLSPYIFDWPNLMNGKSHKQSITEKRLFAILPKSYNYVYFLWKNL